MNFEVRLMPKTVKLYVLGHIRYLNLHLLQIYSFSGLYIYIYICTLTHIRFV